MRAQSFRTMAEPRRGIPLPVKRGKLDRAKYYVEYVHVHEYQCDLFHASIGGLLSAQQQVTDTQV